MIAAARNSCNFAIVLLGREDLLKDSAKLYFADNTAVFDVGKNLFEVADSLTEIKTVCACGHKATGNARIAGGRIVTEGEQVFLGGNESYVAMCYKCWQEKIKKQREEDNQ